MISSRPKKCWYTIPEDTVLLQALTTMQLISVQSTCRTRFSPIVTLARPSVSSSLQMTNLTALLDMQCITIPLESAPFFIPSTSFCSLSSWFTSSCAYHLITVTTFALTICHSLSLSPQTQNSSLSQILSPGLPSRILNSDRSYWARRWFVLIFFLLILFLFWLRLLD